MGRCSVPELPYHSQRDRSRGLLSRQGQASIPVIGLGWRSGAAPALHRQQVGNVSQARTCAHLYTHVLCPLIQVHSTPSPCTEHVWHAQGLRHAVGWRHQLQSAPQPPHSSCAAHPRSPPAAPQLVVTAWSKRSQALHNQQADVGCYTHVDEWRLCCWPFLQRCDGDTTMALTGS